ncbi:MAG: DUF928 domain-containing protein [Chloroflexi bacterium AL-N15]|nr:DUF928 domain-containing protein [Chloroflexi bacterium AL-N15]
MKKLISKSYKISLSLITIGISLIVSNAFVFAQNIPKSWSSKFYRPPANLGTPIYTLPGGVRGELISLVPLLPVVENYRFGVTVEPYPTFLIYIPKMNISVKYAQFSLKDKDGGEIYKADFIVKNDNQIISVSLPEDAGLTPLNIDRDYQWTFSVFADSLRVDSPKMTSSGWIRRVEVPSELASEQILPVTSDKQARINQSRLYAESGIWYDTAANLAQLYRDYPNDPEIKEDWQQLLKSAELDELLEVPLFSPEKSGL